MLVVIRNVFGVLIRGYVTYIDGEVVEKKEDSMWVSAREYRVKMTNQDGKCCYR